MKTHSKEKIQHVDELHKAARKNYPRRRTIIKGLDDLWQMDLAEMRQYAAQNRNYKMIMLVIDCFSKHIWTRPLKNILPEITKNYNGTIHRTTGYKPRDVNKSNEEAILKSAYSHIKIMGKPKFKVGDIVRVSKSKHVFEKSYKPNWTTELFKIVKVQITNPITYLLEDMQERPIRGGFYEEELQKTRNPDIYLVEKVLKRKGKKVYVRWLGFDRSHDCWIDITNIV
ncbi:hypothetical protein NQ315_014248 [Exocentrus adspersus]|uniref:Chromo domain-containing protein n=1 Tax=Exocentrus adspersus TaxID=1586481 RepID=A0AAV8V9S2_9CUCU|nr:hypothetical protein NQ315_014248 [Exocentrus adspersus]